VSPSTLSAAGKARDMKAELLAWKQEKAAKMAQQKADKAQNPGPFRVPKPHASPNRTASMLITSSENEPCTAPCSAPSKAPKKAGNVARTALGERCPNTDASRGEGRCFERSVSPPARVYNPPARSRAKTPEPKRAPKTPEPRRPQCTSPEQRAAPNAAKSAEVVAPEASVQEAFSPEPAAPTVAENALEIAAVPEPAAPSVAEEDAPDVAAVPEPVAPESAPVPEPAAPTVVEHALEVAPAAKELQEEEVLPTITAEIAVEEPAPQTPSPVEESPLVLSPREPSPSPLALSPREDADEIADAEEAGGNEDDLRKMASLISLGAASPSSPPPPPPCSVMAPPAAPMGPPPELPVEASSPAALAELSEDLPDSASETSAPDETRERFQTSASETRERFFTAVSEAQPSQKAAEEHPRPSGATTEDTLGASTEVAVAELISSVEAASTALSCQLQAASPPAVGHGVSMLAAYLPASVPATGASPSVAARVGGGLMAALEERAALPRMPPPSPATPSVTLALARSTSAEMPEFANASVTEFARAAGVALQRYVAEDQPLPSPSPLRRDLIAVLSAETPNGATQTIEEEPDCEPPSPLSLESQSPLTSARDCGVADYEDIPEVKLES